MELAFDVGDQVGSGENGLFLSAKGESGPGYVGEHLVGNVGGVDSSELALVGECGGPAG